MPLELADAIAPPEGPDQEYLWTLNFGPQHPATHTTLRLVLELDGERIVVKTLTNDPVPKLPSAYPLWRGADWMEREVYDMYGIVFEGHPDLRRILMPEECTCFPLRKDYPLRGRGERHNFPVITRAES